MAGLGIVDNSGDLNGLAVNTDHEASVALNQDSEKSGFVSMASEKGVKPNGDRVMKEVECSDNYRLRVENDNILFNDYPTGTALNTSILTTRLSASQTVVVGSNRYELNSSGLTTINSGSMIRTIRTFPWFKANALYAETALSWSLEPVANWFAEWGLFDATSAIAAISNGAFFRISNNTFRGVMCNGGTESYVDLGAVPTAGDVHDTVIEMCQGIVYFWVNDVLKGTIEVPAAQFAPLGLSQIQLAVRTYNGSVIPSVAIKLQVSALQVSIGGFDVNRLWPTVCAGMGRSSCLVPSGAAAGQTANWANSAAVTMIAAASLANTTPAFTGLGGQFFVGASAAADTDLHIMNYLVPVGSTLVIRGARIETANMVVAVATTAHLLQWAIGIGSSASTLAGTEDAIGVTVRRVVPMGLQHFPVASPVGYTPPALDYNFDSPLVVYGGQYVSFFYKVLVGTATATQGFRGTIMVNGYFE
jgi:hypothetical protein